MTRPKILGTGSAASPEDARRPEIVGAANTTSRRKDTAVETAIGVCEVNHLGDAVCFLPTLRAIARARTDTSVLVVCTPVAKEVFQGSSPNLVFTTVPYDHFRGVRGICLGAAMGLERRRKMETVLLSYDEPGASYALALISGARRRVGYDSRLATLESTITERIPCAISKHAIDLNYDLARHFLGGSCPPLDRVPIAIPEDARKTVDEIMTSKGVKRPYAAIHPYSKLPYRAWSENKFSDVAAWLIGRGFDVIWLSATETAGPPGAHVVHGVGVKVMAGLIEGAALFIGNNSGPFNVACAMGTPSCVVQGPSPDRWGSFWKDVPVRIVRLPGGLSCMPCERFGAVPGYCANKVQYEACMRDLAPVSVTEALEDLLGELNGRIHG